MNKMPKGCDQQGRYPEAAECCTEVGQEEPDFYSKDHILEELGAIAIAAVAIVTVIGMISFFIGRYV